MARISSTVIEEIKQLSIVDIISPHMDLTRKGRSILGLCPFHNEKTPSFHVNEDKGFFKCFGCNEAGDAITFIMKYKNYDYVDAVTYICENHGVELKFDSEYTSSKPVAEIKKLHEAVANYAAELLFSPKGKAALDYVKNRGFDENTIRRFDIGFLPENVIISDFDRKFSREVLVDSGIFYNQRGVLRCFFEDRILFPIKSYTGACIGFSGRSMNPNEKAKYKNSPETAIFSKRRELFNLNIAKDAMVNSKKCYIVEGYFDVMRMVEAGYEETVAIMGTAFTKEQVNQLKRYAEEYNLILDGDEAGQKAMRDSRAVAIDSNIYPYVVFLPAGEDPDTFIREKGKNSFDVLVDSKEDLLLYTIKSQRAKAKDQNSIFNRLESVKKMLNLIQNPYRQEYYAKETAEIFQVSENTLYADISKNDSEIKIIEINKNEKFDYVGEKDFFAALIKLPDESVFRLLEGMSEEHFEDKSSKAIYKKILELFAQNGTITTLINEQGFEEYRSELLLVGAQHAEDAHFTASVSRNKIISNYLTKKRIMLISKLKGSTEEDEKERLFQKIEEILKEVKQLQTQNFLIN